jgi:hypothetical protein
MKGISGKLALLLISSNIQLLNEFLIIIKRFYLLFVIRNTNKTDVNGDIINKILLHFSNSTPGIVTSLKNVKGNSNKT